MGFDSSEVVADALERAKSELTLLARASEKDIQALGSGFGELTIQTQVILPLASAIVTSIESKGVSSVLTRVQALGEAAKDFLGVRLEATTGIMDTVTCEVALLRQLLHITKSQATIALKTRVLTMLINIEVGRLGPSGLGFKHLAEELGHFSISLTEDAEQLVRQADTRRLAIELTHSVLGAQLPHLREEFARINVVLGKELGALESGLARLSSVPVHFKTCVEDLMQQIDGVVAAIQSHDITRQQIEHVQEACTLISSELRAGRRGKQGTSNSLSRAYACICIQIYQLKNIQATISNWTTQIRTCMEVILKVGASDLAQISPLVLEQQQQISSNLVHIELLEREGEAYGEKIQKTVGSHTSLVDMIAEQVDKAKVIRQRLHLLSLNSIIEASRMGSDANTIIELGKGISDLSNEWSLITDRSGKAMEEIVAVVEHTAGMMQTFSGSKDEGLRQAQDQIAASLAELKAAAVSATRKSEGIERATLQMQSMSAEVAKSGNLLDISYARLDPVLRQLEHLKEQLEIETPNIRSGYKTNEMSRLFSASYTTEIEREVMHAALDGAPLPIAQQILSGNEIELF